MIARRLQAFAARKKSSPAAQFIAAATARCPRCDFERVDDSTVFLFWLQGSGGVVPYLVNLADQLKVTLTLVVEIYSANHGGRLVPYYQRHGFTIVDSEFPKNTDFSKLRPRRDGEARGMVEMHRTPRGG